MIKSIAYKLIFEIEEATTQSLSLGQHSLYIDSDRGQYRVGTI